MLLVVGRYYTNTFSFLLIWCSLRALKQQLRDLELPRGHHDWLPVFFHLTEMEVSSYVQACHFCCPSHMYSFYLGTEHVCCLLHIYIWSILGNAPFAHGLSKIISSNLLSAQKLASLTAGFLLYHPKKLNSLITVTWQCLLFCSPKNSRKSVWGF